MRPWMIPWLFPFALVVAVISLVLLPAWAVGIVLVVIVGLALVGLGAWARDESTPRPRWMQGWRPPQ